MHRSLEYILGKIPKTGPWVHDTIPQFRGKEGQNCLLVLGFCPQYREDSWRLKDVPQSLANQSSFGDAFTIAIRKLFPTATFLFSRKECRKTKSRG